MDQPFLKDNDFFKSKELDEGGAVLEKAKAFPEGTIREWKGKRFQKRGGKWLPFRGKGKSKKKSSKEVSYKDLNGFNIYDFQNIKDYLKENKNNVDKTLEAMKEDGMDEGYGGEFTKEDIELVNKFKDDVKWEYGIKKKSKKFPHIEHTEQDHEPMTILSKHPINFDTDY